MEAPSPSPWPIVALIAAAVAVAWPPDRGRSVAVRAVNRLADPSGALPRRPEPLAMGLDDDADVVTAHDMEERQYERLSQQSAMMRFRLRMRDLEDPMEPSAERPVLVAIGALGALVAFRRRDRGPR